MNYAETFGKNLKAIRKSKNLSQVDIAEMLSIDVANVSRYESGKQCPDLIKFFILAKRLEVTPSDFIRENHD